LPLSGCQVVARGAALADCQGNSRAAAWRPLNGNPKGRVGAGHANSTSRP